jgi:D-alanine-D-alanine ligase
LVIGLKLLNDEKTFLAGRKSVMSNNKKLRLGMIFGGRSGEHEVSLMSARSVLSALDPEKYTVTQIGITHDGVWLVGDDVLEAMLAERYTSLNPATLLPDPTRPGLFMINDSNREKMLQYLTDLDIVFPLLHGTFGEDGTVQGLFEIAGLAYVGAGVLGSSVGMDKGVFKDVMRANDIPVLESLILLRNEIQADMEAVLERSEQLAPYPLFVKPANLGSSVGVSKCRNRSDLLEGVMDAARYDRRILVERGVNGREIELSVLGNDKPQASIPGEVIPSREFYSYEAKYHDGSSELLIPAPIADELISKVQSIAKKAYQAIDCAGMARADFLLDKDSGDLYLNELNTIPGFTMISMYPKLWEASGLSYPELVDRLIELALERKSERDQTEHRYFRS